MRMNSQASLSARLAGCLSVAIATAAHAADLGGPPSSGWRSPPSAYQPLPTWTGLYAGIQAGYGWGRMEAEAVWGLLGGPTESFDYDPSGAVGGVHLGYNSQIGRFVLGVESDLEASGLSGSGFGNYSAIHNSSLEWLGSLRGRVGVTAGSSLLYLTGGLAYGSISVEQRSVFGLSPFTSDTQMKTGWTVGGGIEHAFAPKVSVRLEYRYLDLGTVVYSNPLLNMRESADLTAHTVRGGLSFKF